MSLPLHPIPCTPHPDKPKLLIIDDDESIRTQVKWALAQDYEVFLAEDAEEGHRAFNGEQPPLVTLDLGLPPYPADTSVGLKLACDILQYEPMVKVIVVSGILKKRCY